MRSGETLQSYANMYWELYNKIGGRNKQVATNNFRLGLPQESELRDSLTMRPLENMHQLMRRIEEYKRLDDDRLQGKGKVPASSQYNEDYRLERFQQRTRREPRVSSVDLVQRTKGVNVTFKEPIYKILERIKNEPYFLWLGKMGKDLARKNQSLYYTYHREKGHTNKQCRVLKDHLEQLIKARHLKEFVVGQGGGSIG